MAKRRWHAIGRKNYEGFAAYWPSAAGDGRWADMLNPMPKWVASTTLTAPLEWNATLIEGDVAEAVQRLTDDHDRDLISSGCGGLRAFLGRARPCRLVDVLGQPDDPGPR